jgi:membrane protease YdiL (CAAX protease family)
MRQLLFDGSGRLRNGWWVLVFLLIQTTCFTGFQVVAPILKRHGVQAGVWVEGMLALFTLLATWICCHWRGESLAAVGLAPGRRWLREAAWGTLIGGGLMLVGAGLLWAAGGVTWVLDPARSLHRLGIGFLGFLLVALFEEGLFRGFLFQRLLEGLGVWPTQILMALLFALVHWGNPGMHGATRVWATADIALAALFLGLAYLRTRSLALPIGIHLGWNWFQGDVLGFGVSGTGGQQGWIQPVFHGKPEWVTGGAFGLEASVFGVVAVVLALFLLWRWQGTAGA